ncbi:MAG: tRNA pseudouridine(38-40) synthase TruA, partial [Lachnospiraceae bacterium]|nr:tRNA pseudouridine(38-40) synthase TruA [Lachnospiraceae bacterium]
MKRIMLTVAYDGTNYHGWQLQPNVTTIESVLNETLSTLLKEDIRVIGASRTDTGVHALGNIAVFDTQARMPADKFSYALNQRLPEDIRIQASREVAQDFHPRRQESRKTYEYKILNSAFPMPIYRLYSHFTYVPLDVVSMQRAADYLAGEHDFKSFCSVNTTAETTVRTIYDINVEKTRDLITIQ